MRYEPSFVGRIVTIIACLHNMCIHEGLNVLDFTTMEDKENEYYDELDEEENIILASDNDELEEGKAVRENINSLYF